MSLYLPLSLPKSWPSLSTLSEPQNLSSVSTDPHLPFEAIRTAISEFGDRLEAFCEEEINTVSQTGQLKRGMQQTDRQRQIYNTFVKDFMICLNSGW